MRRIKQLTLVRADWLDAALIPGTREIAEMAKATAVLARSAGFLLRHDKHELVLATTLNDQGEASDPIVIPAKMVLRVRAVR